LYKMTLLFFDISSGELLLILFVTFLVFGPGKFPELARKLGKGMNELRRASESIKEEIRKEAANIEKEEITVKSPKRNKEASGTKDPIPDKSAGNEQIDETVKPLNKDDDNTLKTSEAIYGDLGEEKKA